MAVSPGMTTLPMLTSRSVPPLFERLPDRLFSPLASANRHRYWALLCRLHEKRFSPDAPLPPSHGFPIRDILQDVEDVLLTQDIWEHEQGETPDTPLNVRANLIFNRLVDCGWFNLEHHGVIKHVTMRPAVNQFLSNLVSFAQTGPVFVSGKIRSIDLNVQQLAQEQATGDTLVESAEQARYLLEHVRNTGTNIRDIMDALRKQETSTADYIQRFFKEYIEHVFIGDYRELRTRDHPLSRRHQILRTVEMLYESDSHRERLISWYQSKRCAGDRNKAELLFTKDIHRLLELQRIDEYLDRLDDEVRTANRAALAFLDFRLRSLRPLDHLLQRAIKNLVAGTVDELSDPFPTGPMISQEGLADPRQLTNRRHAATLRKQIPSDEQIAKSRVMRRARDARTITPPKLTEYVLKILKGQAQIHSQNLPLSTIEEVRAFQILSATGMAFSANSRRLQMLAMSQARGFRVNLLAEPESTQQPITGRPFILAASQKRKIKPKSDSTP